MGDTNVMKNPFSLGGDDDLSDYNEVYQDGNTFTKSNEGSGASIEDPDCAIDDAQKAQFQAKYGDEMYYEPFMPKPPRGSVEDIQHRLRITGVRLRKELNYDLHTNTENWTALRRPASLHTAQRTLAEMLRSIPSADQEPYELGDGYVYMPLQVMEKYLYPTLRVMPQP